MTKASRLHVKRARHLFFELEDQQVVDIGSLLRGEVKLTTQPSLQALSLLTATKFPVAAAEIELLLLVPRRSWLAVEELLENTSVKSETIERMVASGLLLSDGPEPELRDLRLRDQNLEVAGWPALAALFHFMNRWRDRDVEIPDDPRAQDALSERSAERFELLAEQRGTAPPTFHSPANAGPSTPLPPAAREAPLYHLLAQRRTTRRFDPKRSLPREDLATLLFHVFGHLGSSRLSTDLEVLRKSSPSGGALHPIEAYPLIRDVEGLEPGFYHYDVRNHGLSLMRSLSVDQAAEFADRLTAGQTYPREAHVLVALIARFRRNFWKYGDNAKTYSVLLMDAAHLSQTFYMVAAELGLGAFFSAAINGANLEQELGLEPALEGAIAVCGCGIPAAADDPRPSLGLDPEPR